MPPVRCWRAWPWPGRRCCSAWATGVPPSKPPWPSAPPAMGSRGRLTSRVTSTCAWPSAMVSRTRPRTNGRWPSWQMRACCRPSSCTSWWCARRASSSVGRPMRRAWRWPIRRCSTCSTLTSATPVPTRPRRRAWPVTWRPSSCACWTPPGGRNTCAVTAAGPACRPPHRRRCASAPAIRRPKSCTCSPALPVRPTCPACSCGRCRMADVAWASTRRSTGSTAQV